MTRTKVAAYWKKALLALVVTLVIVQFMEQFVSFQNVDHAFLDIFTRFKTPSVPKGIYIVEITDDDYRNFFNSTSPLSPHVLLELIDSLLSNAPHSAIGVDLDTAEWNQNSEWNSGSTVNPKPGRLQRQYSEELSAANIVWAGVPEEVPHDRESENALSLDCPLGGAIPSTAIDKIGVVLLPQDADGVVRRHQRYFRPVSLKKCSDASSGTSPDRLSTFDVALEGKCVSSGLECLNNLRDCKAEAKVHGVCPRSGSTADWLVRTFKVDPPKNEYVNFSGEPHSFQVTAASLFLERCDATEKQPCAKVKALGKDQQELLKDHVILLGGAYKAARDDYWTPRGKMQGIELFANGVQAAATNDYTVSDDWWPFRVLAIGVDVLCGLFIAGIYCLFGRVRYVQGLMSFVGFMIPPASVLAFHHLNLWNGAAFVMLGMLVHSAIDRFQEGKSELNQLRQELRETKDALRLHTKHTDVTKITEPADRMIREEITKTDSTHIQLQDNPKAAAKES